jgi:hypothetical protein
MACVCYVRLQISSVLSAFFGVAFNPHIGLRCGPAAADASKLELQEVRLCLSRHDFTRYNCRWVGTLLPVCMTLQVALLAECTQVAQGMCHYYGRKFG